MPATAEAIRQRAPMARDRLRKRDGNVMNLRLTRRRLGSLAAVSILAGCAMPPGPQDQAASDALRTKDVAFNAPQGYGSALAALPASGTAKDNSLANAQAIDENSPDVHSFHQTGRASWY